MKALTNTRICSNLKKGKQKCKLWLGKEGDGLSQTTTSSVSDIPDEIERIEKVRFCSAIHNLTFADYLIFAQQLKRQELGEIPRSEWVDQMVFREIERKNATAKRDELYLVVEFPRYDFNVIYADYEYPIPARPSAALGQGTNPTPAGQPPAEEDDDEDNMENWPNYVWDPAAEMDNPCELKHRRLVRSHRNGPLDKELKPNAKIRDELHVCDFMLLEKTFEGLLDVTGNYALLPHTRSDKRRKGSFMEVQVLSY